MSLRDLWNRKRERDKEAGFTLIEVLAAIVILSIVSLVLTSYFTNALSYSKSNQNKTIMVNLARNALFYMEKQDFGAMGDFFEVSNDSRDPEDHPEINADNCTSTTNCTAYGIMINAGALPDVLNPIINNIPYKVTIVFQVDLYQDMKEGEEGKVDPRKQDMAPYLIPIQVEVTGEGGPNGHSVSTVVEGYITDEKIR
ncbi:prepilin-type N-terminal cleavage/methylation domain-containing protein [Paenibacillus sp. MMS20-IR301]|uniref:prepilin-type N-terminal cleavage/methylation domain-containing protein n=1 Tax=Paenibacillus sp. MMS20-IR301 TaxID=2895946 RepID=UPI0028E94838|nr:prepilin-type N-terminal cleavage/methylation domain-containing protein [Paenibacillus sp. MMS20-IR301]WNS42686.1 prepilin-type N-terminal cleavage/methylation domain-containing protein [Paenibacillus sp. MMS20-IR301]